MAVWHHITVFTAVLNLSTPTHLHTQHSMADPLPSPSPQAPSPAHPSPDKPSPIEPLDVFQPETVDCLVAGFLAVLEPEMVRVQQSLQELT